MNTNININEVIKQYFDQLGIDPIDFNYDEAKKQFVSKESFSYDDDDPEAYYIVVKLTNTVGTVVIGTSDGIRFNEVDVLGQIVFNGKDWEIA